MSTTMDLTVRIGGDLPVHRLGLGAMRLVDTWAPEADWKHGMTLARRAVDLGVTFIDTSVSTV